MDDIITWFVLTSTHMEIRDMGTLSSKKSGAAMVGSRALEILLKSQERTLGIFQKVIPPFLLSVFIHSHGETLVTWCVGGRRDDRSTRYACFYVFYVSPPRGVEFLLTRRDKRHRSPAHIYYTRASRSR